METTEIFQILIGSGGLLGIIILVFRTGKIVEKVENSDKKISEIKDDIKDIKRALGNMEVQIGKLETRVEERTLRVIHVEGPEKQQKAK